MSDIEMKELAPVTDYRAWRQRHIICRALAYAIVTIERLPESHQPESDLQDMNDLLAAYDKGGSHHLAVARCAIDQVTGVEAVRAVYREYGIELPEEFGAAA